MRRWTAALLLPLLCGPAFAGTALPDAPHVVVHGEGKVIGTPDWALVTMEVRKRSADAAEAKRMVDRAVDALLAVAPGYGISADDISADDLELGEHVERRFDDGSDMPKPQRQHVAVREVKVRLDDLARLGAYTDAALAAGFTDIASIAFKSDDEERLRQEARLAAIADAKDRAAGLAQAFGAKAGSVYSINSMGSMMSHGYGDLSLDMMSATAVKQSAGQYLQPKVEFTERVAAVFELQR